MAQTGQQQKPGKFNVTVTVGIVAAIGAVLVCYLYAINDSWRDEMRFFLPVAGIAAGLTSAWYVATNVAQAARANEIASQASETATKAAEANARAAEANARQQILTRTYSYPQRWGDAAFELARETSKRIVLQYQKDPDRWQKIRDLLEADAKTEHPVLERSLIDTVNFLEEMALAILVADIDEEITKRYFRTIVLRTWKALRPWIMHVRDTRGERFGVELEALVKSWEN